MRRPVPVPRLARDLARVLAASALLAGPAAGGETLLAEGRWGDVRVTLVMGTAAPRALEAIRFRLEGRGDGGRPFEGGAVLYLTPLDAAGPAQTAVLGRTGPGRLEGRVRLPEPGHWRLQAVLTGSGPGTHRLPDITLDVAPFEWLGFGEEFGFFVGLSAVFLVLMFGLARRLRRRSPARPPLDPAGMRSG